MGKMGNGNQTHSEGLDEQEKKSLLKRRDSKGI